MSFKSNHTEFEYYTLICAIHEEGGKVYIVLDRSEFYAEGGGQPSDQGTIAGHPVRSVREVAGANWHEIEDPAELFKGMRVKVEVDAFHRMEMSRQHTGQHLLSAFLHNEVAIRTVGFHIGPDTATIDTDRPVDEEVLEEVALKINQAILEGLEVTSFVEPAQKIQELGLRKEVDLTGDVQIVRIADLDVSACCGTHVDSTRDLLFFLVRKAENYKGGTRIYFQFGRRALDFAMEAVRIVQDAKEQLAIHETEIPFRLRLLVEQTQEDEKKITELRSKLAGQMLLLPEYNGSLVYQELDEEEELIRTLAVELGRQKRNSILLDLRERRIYGNIFKDPIHAGNLFREQKIPGVRGGGGPRAFQGVADSEEELVEFGRRLQSALEGVLQ